MIILTISDLLAISILCVAAIAWLAMSAPVWIKQAMCKHQGAIAETSACDAICCDCGRNLGFIGEVRKARSEQAKGAGHG